MKRFFILLLLCSLTASNGFTQCRQSDSLQLVALYNATDGANWYNKTNWLSSNPLETWYGVTLHAYGCVDTLRLSFNGLRGNLPNLNFPALRELWLQYNSLTGSIPNLNLPYLTRLQLNNNQLTGSLPNFSGPNYNLSNLLILSLSDNRLTGNIPVLYFYYLQFLGLSNNRFTGSIPNVSHSMPSLRQLAVSNNQLTGSIPPLTLYYLRWIDLDGNQLTGTVPNFSSNMGWVKIQSNRFTFGDMLTCLSNLSAATTKVYTPQDSFFTTTTYSKYTGDALTIDLGIDAAITSNVYHWYKNGTLYQTNIGNNRLIFNNLALTDAGVYTCQVINPNAPLLTLYSRKATVNVTPSCRRSDSLALVNLYNATNGANWINKTNWLSVNPINTWYGIVINAEGCVTGINLPSNRLNGNIPNFNLPNLQVLYLQSNQLIGNIPNFNLPNLLNLYLYSNQLSGSIPNFNLPNLQRLYLQSNQLSGNIPNFNLPNLIELILASNQLIGVVPNFNFPILQHLFLNSNQLIGSLPNFNFPSLISLSFYKNKIDSVPNLSRLTRLTTIKADTNRVTFDDILPNLARGMTYTGQDSIYVDTTFSKNVGQSLTINLGIDGAITTNKYKWYKNGILFDSTTVNQLIINNLQLSHAGIYTCKVTNLNAPLLTLYSRKVTLIVNCSPIVTEQFFILRQGDSIRVNDTILRTAGTYRQVIQRPNACDTTIITVLNVIDSCAAIPTNGLVFAGGFNGNAQDLSGNGNHGTVNGATLTTDRFGKPNQAYRFNGVDNYYINCGNPASLNMSGGAEMTMELWFKFISVVDSLHHAILLNKEGEYECAINYDGKLICAFGTQTGFWDWVQTNYVVNNQWNHLAITFNRNTVKTYLNGVKIHTNIDTPLNLVDADPALNDFRIGNRQNSNQTFNGSIDDVHIYNRSLTEVEIVNLYGHIPVEEVRKDTTICAGKSIVINNHRYDTTGIYRDTVKTIQYQCDSVIQITNLTVTPAPSYDRYYSIVEGGSLPLGNRIVREAGVYPDTIRVMGGCDTIRRNIVAVLDPCASNMSTQGLVAYYDFKNNANDKSGNGNHATVYGASLTQGRYEEPNSAYRFNGVDNYMLVNNSPSLQLTTAGSISAWVKPTGFYAGECQGNVIICNDHDYQTGKFVLAYGDWPFDYNCAVYSPNNNQFWVQAPLAASTITHPNGMTVSPGFIVRNQWYMVTSVFDTQSIKLYVNGVLKDSIRNTFGIQSSLSQWLIGKMNNVGYPYWLNGVMDDIAIYNRALDTTEIKQLYNNGRPVESTQTLTICSGQSITVGDTTYRTTGNYRKILKTALYRCDSVVNTNLTVTPPLRYEQYFTIRPGQTITVNGHSIAQPRVFHDSIPTANGCDSIVKTTVAMMDHCANDLDNQDLIFFMPADGNANDMSGLDNNMTYNTATLAKNRFNHPNRSYQFNNSGMNTRVDSTFSSAEITLSAWITVEGTGTHHPRIVAVGSTTLHQHYYGLILETNANNSRQLTFVTPDSHAFRSARRIPIDSQWYHVAATFKQGVVKLYINGVLDGQLTIGRTALSSFSEAIIQVGYSQNNGLDRWNGKIDDIFIFKRALTDAQIRALYERYPVIRIEKDTTVCGGQSILVGNRRHDTTGIYIDTLQTIHYQCDSVVRTRLTVLPIRRDTLRNIAFCEGDFVVINNDTIRTGNPITQRLPSYEGCDSFLTILPRVKLKKTNSIRHQMCQGESYRFGDRVLTVQDIYTHPFRTFEDCDSLVTLNLIVIPPVYKTRYDTICEGQFVTIGNRTYNRTGTFNTTLPNFQNCDSIVILHLTVHPIVRQRDSISICAGDSAWTGRRWVKIAATYSETFPSWRNCDSIKTLIVTVKPILRTTQRPILCSGRGITVGDSTYYVSGIYIDTLQSVQYQCDSIVTTILTITPPLRYNVPQTICANESFRFRDSTYRIAGLYRDTSRHPRGENVCDTAFEIHLTVSPLRVGTLQRRQLCQGDSLWLHGRWIFAADSTYQDTLSKTQFGLPCDTIARIQVELLRRDSVDSLLYSCNRRDVGLVIDSSTVNPAGCKRYIFKYTSLLPTDVVTISGNEGFCEGSFTTLSVPSGYRYRWSTGDTTQQIQARVTGDYTVTITNSSGCQSPATKYVFTNPLPHATIVGTSAFCAGERPVLTTVARFCRFQWSTGATSDTIQPFRTGDYSVTATDFNGCKDTVNHFVRVHPLPNFQIAGKLYFCEGTQTELTVEAVTPTPPMVQYLWSTNAITHKIKVWQNTNYAVTVTSDSGCTATKQVFVKGYITDRPADIKYDSICQGERYPFPSGRSATTTGFYKDTIKWAGVECDKIIRNYRIVVRDSIIRTTITNLCDPELQTTPDSIPENTTVGCRGYHVKKNIFKLDSCFYTFPIHGGLMIGGNAENDYFHIPYVQFLPANELRIADRRGITVYQKINYDNKWSGTDLQGNPLPEGEYSYWFKLIADNKTYIRTGIIKINYVN